MSALVVILFLCFSQTWANQKDFRIVDGVEANFAQFPFSVAYYIDQSYFCGGSILTNRWILTAAHCLHGRSDFIVLLGSTNLGQLSSDGLTIRTITFVTHPEYNPETYEHDIGLIWLPTTLQFSDNIRPIELPSRQLQPYERATALGWGATSNDTSVAPTLLYHVELSTVSNAVCRRTYGEAVKETMLCAVGNGNQGICEGDSGGPLVQTTVEGKTIQVGVACFFSAAGCETAHPSGFTRTFEYLQWIRNVTDYELEEPNPSPPPPDTGSGSALFLYLPVAMILQSITYLI